METITSKELVERYSYIADKIKRYITETGNVPTIEFIEKCEDIFYEGTIADETDEYFKVLSVFSQFNREIFLYKDRYLHAKYKTYRYISLLYHVSRMVYLSYKMRAIVE